MFFSTWEGATDNIDALELDTTRGRPKHEVYSIVSEKYFVPAWTSKGVTREYLLRVLRDENFRVEKKAVKKFECDLTDKQQKRNGNQSCAFIVKKINLLGNQRIAAGGQVKRAKKRITSVKRTAAD